MKSITLSYPTYRTTTINVTRLPERYKRWLEAVFTDEDDRSDAQWNLAEKHNYYPEIIRLATGDTVDPYDDIDVEDYEE